MKPYKARLSVDRRELLARLVAEGVTPAQMQHKYNFNIKTIRGLYPEYWELKRRRSVPELIADNQGVFDELVAERAPGYLIAEALGVSTLTLRRSRPDVSWTPEEVGHHVEMMRQMGLV